MRLEIRMQKIEDKVDAHIQKHRPLLVIDHREDKVEKLKELRALHGQDFDPVFKLSFKDCSSEELISIIKGEPTHKFDGWSAEELTDLLLNRQ